MKRSEINRIIGDAESFFARQHFSLPAWARWSRDQWEEAGSRCSGIIACQLGWDITDFGSSDFARRGLVLFTLRNGLPDGTWKTYAEKIMVVREEQETPFHFHWKKREDIINRGGGILVFELYRSREDGTLSDEPLTVSVDSCPREIAAGSLLELMPGESLTLEPFVYHRFYGRKGAGLVLVGEVSSVNDDTADNRFLEAPERFPEIIEDEPAVRLLVGDYAALPFSAAGSAAGSVPS